MQKPSSARQEFLTVDEVAHRLDLSRRTIWRYVADRAFPEPVRFSKKRVRWRSRDIDAYLARIATVPMRNAPRKRGA